MNTRNVKRKLAAILSADVVGYSRLMGADEMDAIRTLPGCRKGESSIQTQRRTYGC